MYLCMLWRIAFPVNYQEQNLHSEEEHTSPRRSAFSHRTRKKDEKCGFQPTTGKLVTTMGTCTWQKINRQGSEEISSERDTQMEEFS